MFNLIKSIYIPIDGMDTHAGVSDKQPGKVKMAKDSDSGKVTITKNIKLVTKLQKNTKLQKILN